MPEFDGEFRFRVDSDLQQAFKRVAHANDRTMSQLLRDFMRDYIEHNADALQSSIADHVPTDE